MRDKNTSVRDCAKTAGGAYARGGAYLRDTTVHFINTLVIYVFTRAYLYAVENSVVISTR